MKKKTPESIDLHAEGVIQDIHTLMNRCALETEGLGAELITQMIQTSLRLLQEGHGLGQLKLINRALKEMRYAYNIFNKYPNARCVSIFGSARTPEDHPDYVTARTFSMEMAELGWMCISGAADGIMKAAIEGAQAESTFGLSIHLPFETSANIILEKDPKLMIFRYFFTRKLMFISHSSAVVAFPGGVGTMDELFEVLTLMQTGKSNIIPLVLLEKPKGSYWKSWKRYVNKNLLENGWISPDDMHLFYIAPSTGSAVQHILQFYRRYHSSRYVNDLLVIRMISPLNEAQLKKLNRKFSKLIESGEIYMSKALPEENDYLELPRLVFHHKRRNFSLLRLLIDEINNL